MSLPQDDYLAKDGVALAEAVARRDLCAREVLDAALARADAARGLNAVVRRYDGVGEAMAEAVAPGASPLAGVPTLTEDVGGQMAGMVFRAGSRWIPEAVQGADNAFAAGMRRAGMVALGVTNAPDLACPASPSPYSTAPRSTPGRRTSPLAARAGARRRRSPRACPDRPRHRRWRLDPHPGRLLRPGGTEVLARTPLAGARRGVG